MNKKKHYIYRGPVWTGFHLRIEERWHGETTAPSREKAICNLMYQYKKECNLPLYASLYLDIYRVIESESISEDEDEKSPDFDQDVVVSEDKDETCCVSQLTLF